MKNLFFSLLVVGVAVAGSAFTSKTVANDHYVQSSTGQYKLITPAEWTPADCSIASTQVCSFIQTTSEVLPTNLTAAQVAAYVTAGKLEPVKDLSGNQIKGLYNM